LNESSCTLSIIIPNFNGEKFINCCLQSILASHYCDFEVMVIDNNSADSSLSKLNQFKHDKRVTVIPLTKNMNYAQANNMGIARSKGKLLLFLNNDTTIEENCLDEISKIFSSFPDIDALQCLLLKMSDKKMQPIGGGLDYSGRLLPITYLWSNNRILKEQRRLFWGTGAALAVRRSVLEKVNGFDPDLPTDEVDLCWRINLGGGKIVLASKAVVNHFGSASFGKELNAKRFYYAELSLLTALIRNFDLWSLSNALLYFALSLPMTFALDLIIRRRPDVLLNRMTAYSHILTRLRKILSQRSFVQTRLRKVGDYQIKGLMVPPNPMFYFRNLQKD
jgi:GT2 family glycosyltransferase